MAKGPLIETKGFLSFLILHEIGRTPKSGDELAEAIGARKGGAPLTPGTIYPTLKRLRKLKLVKFTRFGRKKVYELTPIGKKELKKLYTEISTLFKGVKAPAKKKKKTTTKKRSKTSKKKRKK